MATYRTVPGRQTTEAGTREGWYVERSESDDPDDVSEIVSTLYETKPAAEAEAKRLREADPDA